MQEPHRDEALRGLDIYEHVVNTFAQNARAYWKSWGTLGEPIVSSIDTWADMQRAYLAWLREMYGKVGRSGS